MIGRPHPRIWDSGFGVRGSGLVIFWIWESGFGMRGREGFILGFGLPGTSVTCTTVSKAGCFSMSERCKSYQASSKKSNEIAAGVGTVNQAQNKRETPPTCCSPLPPPKQQLLDTLSQRWLHNEAELQVRARMSALALTTAKFVYQRVANVTHCGVSMKGQKVEVIPVICCKAHTSPRPFASGW